MFSQYKNIIKNSNYSSNNKILDESLKKEDVDRILIYYAPFDYINTDAKVVICGITPGLQQALNALIEASTLLKKDVLLSDSEILREAKKTASFSGKMREHLVNMLNGIGFNDYLKIDDAQQLFKDESNLIHYTSLIANPVFKDKKNYSGSSPKILKNTLLRSQLENFCNETSQLSDNTVYIPLGKSVEEVFKYLIKEKLIDVNESHVLFGFPHPSPANGWRTRHFEKNKDALITQINGLKALETKQ